LKEDEQNITSTSIFLYHTLSF